MTFLLEQISQPSLSPRRLEVLATHEDPAVRAAVAANPSTPPVALLSLLAEFPTAVLGNPALVLHQVVDPVLFERASAEMHLRWARHPDMAAWLLVELARSSSRRVRAAVAANPNTPAEVVERLAFPEELGDHAHDPCESAMQHPGLPASLAFDVAMSFASSADPEFDDRPPAAMLDMLLLDPVEADALGGDEAPIDEFWATRLSVDEDDDVADDEGWAPLLWRSPEGPYTMASACDGVCLGGLGEGDEPDRGEATGEFLAGDDEASIWAMTPEELASHPDAPWWLVRCRCRRSDVARLTAVSRPDVPVDELTRLATARSPWLRRAVASHPSTPAGVLAALALADEPMVRLRVALHPCAPAGTLAALASDPSGTVRRAVAANEATPGEVRDRLTRDRWASVRKAAAGLRHDEDDEDAYGDA